MTADYSPFVTLAEDLISDWGQALTLRRITRADHYDSHVGAPVLISTTAETVYGLVLPTSTPKVASPGSVVDFDDSAEGMTTLSRRFVLLKAAGMTGPPSIGDEIDIGDAVYRVTGTTSVAPGGTAIVYRVGVERA